MSVILVAEQDGSYAERIVDVLRSAGWSAQTVSSREAAFEAANASRPRLLIASASLPDASSLLAAFSRDRGGPGSVVLVPVAVAGRVAAADYHADALLDKPFSDDALQDLVRQCFESQSSPTSEASPASSETAQQLTSEDIFGDVLAEVEAEAKRTRPKRPRAQKSSDDINRKLEETLSGVFLDAPPPKRREPTAPARKSRSKNESLSDHEIDDLLDKTLSSLELPTKARRSSPKAPPKAPAAPTAPPVAPPPATSPATATPKAPVAPPASTRPEPSPVLQASPIGDPALDAPPQAPLPSQEPAIEQSLPELERPILGQPTIERAVPEPTMPAVAAPSQEEALPSIDWTPLGGEPTLEAEVAPAPVEAPPEAQGAPASVDWQGFEPPPELFPSSFGDADPTASTESPTIEPPAEVFTADLGDLGTLTEPSNPSPVEPSESLPSFESPPSFESAPSFESSAPSLEFEAPSSIAPSGTETSAELAETPSDAAPPDLEPPSFDELSFEAPSLEEGPGLAAPPVVETPAVLAADGPSTPQTDLDSSGFFDGDASNLFPASFGDEAPPEAATEESPSLSADLFPASFSDESPSWDGPEAPAPEAPPLEPEAAEPPPAAVEESAPAPPVHSFLDSDSPNAEDLNPKHRVMALDDLSAAPAREGETFGDYTLIERIAVGGMAEVWQAQRRGVEGFQKTVAIKRILSHLTDTPDFINMFIDEAKLAAQLSHNHIIQIYDLGKVGEDFFIAMEFVDGKDLRSILNKARKEEKPIPQGLALMIVAALARALDYAHRKKDFEDRALGLVHRDVSPQNVLISYEGEIKLCDFGIVKAVAKASTTQMGALKGKLQYMSPEQAWGKSVDARSDIFSLGSVLFEVLTGERLFTGDSELGVLDAVREGRVRSPRDLVPDLPEEIERIVHRALTKKPEDRYQTAGEMEKELKAVLDSLRPSPSQNDLVAYMTRLFHPPVEFHSYEVREEFPPFPEPQADEPQAQDAPEGDAKDEKKSGRGKKWLLAAMVLVFLATIAFFALREKDSSTTPTTEPQRAESEAAPEPERIREGEEEGASPGEAYETGRGEGGAPIEEAPPAEAEGSDQPGIDLDKMVEEQLLEAQEKLQRKYEEEYEAKRRQLEAQIQETQRTQDDSENSSEGGEG